LVSVVVVARAVTFQECPLTAEPMTSVTVAEPVAPTSGSEDVKVMVLGKAVKELMLAANGLGTGGQCLSTIHSSANSMTRIQKTCLCFRVMLS